MVLATETSAGTTSTSRFTRSARPISVGRERISMVPAIGSTSAVNVAISTVPDGKAFSSVFWAAHPAAASAASNSSFLI